MFIYHATHKLAVASIQRQGLRLDLAVCRPPAIWAAHNAVKLHAAKHAAKRHHWKLDDVVLLRLDIRIEGWHRHASSLFCFTLADVSWVSISAVLSCEGASYVR